MLKILFLKTKVILKIFKLIILKKPFKNEFIKKLDNWTKEAKTMQFSRRCPTLLQKKMS